MLGVQGSEDELRIDEEENKGVKPEHTGNLNLMLYCVNYLTITCQPNILLMV